MAAIDEKINGLAFTRTTAKTFHEVRELAADAAERSAGIVTKIVEQGVDGTQISYAIKRLGAVTVLSFIIRVEPTGGGENEVTLAVGRYLTSQPAIFGFIPMGPKDAAGYPPLRSFSEYVRNHL